MCYHIEPVPLEETITVTDPWAAVEGMGVAPPGPRPPAGRNQVGREGDCDVARRGQRVILCLIGDAVCLQRSAGRLEIHTHRCLDSGQCPLSRQLRRRFSCRQVALRGCDAYVAVQPDLARSSIIVDEIGANCETAVGDDDAPVCLQSLAAVPGRHYIRVYLNGAWGRGFSRR